MSSTPVSRTQRYHGLDGLRGFAMLLGIVVHGALPYFSRMAGLEFMWPADDDQSTLLFLIFLFIHAWRMPTFFLLAGFFAHLILDHRSTVAFILDRLKRIALPLVLFGSLMGVVLPLIWVYGWSGTLSPDSLAGDMNKEKISGSSGEWIAHLWFLYYLLLMYTALIFARLFAGICNRAAIFPLGRIFPRALYTRMPVLMILAATLLLIARAGNESKPVWPINVPDVLYGALFFYYGYGLYARKELLDRFQGKGTLLATWISAGAVFCMHLVAIGIVDGVTKSGGEAEVVKLIGTVFYAASAVLFSVGFVGLFEVLLTKGRPWIRWLADSSYWIYIVHLPVVAFLTFCLAHLDREGRLRCLTGFDWSAELKFLFSCLVTAGISILTYRHLVRYTFLGTLLNGKRSREKCAPGKIPDPSR